MDGPTLLKGRTLTQYGLARLSLPLEVGRCAVENGHCNGHYSGKVPGRHCDVMEDGSCDTIGLRDGIDVVGSGCQG
jgi:hypothetical protein